MPNKSHLPSLILYHVAFFTDTAASVKVLIFKELFKLLWKQGIIISD